MTGFFGLSGVELRVGEVEVDAGFCGAGVVGAGMEAGDFDLS